MTSMAQYNREVAEWREPSHVRAIAKALANRGAYLSAADFIAQHGFDIEYPVFSFWQSGVDGRGNKVRTCWTKEPYYSKDLHLMWKATKVGKVWKYTNFVARTARGGITDAAYRVSRKVRQHTHALKMDRALSEQADDK